jgi:putative transposase
MAYRRRVEVPGLYHVTARGNNKRPIVADDLDRARFFAVLNRIARKHGWELFAVCLMDNHYHLVMRIGERGMSRGMCELNSTYALAFNTRHGRINHLFGRRYWSDELRTESRFLNACRYVFQNPVRAGSAHTPAAYVWSSYRATVGLALSMLPVAGDELLSQFGLEREAAIAAFRTFCETTVTPSRVRGQPP